MGVNRFKEFKKLKLDLGNLNRDHREMCKGLVYPNKRVYVEKYISHDVQMVKPMTFPIAGGSAA